MFVLVIVEELEVRTWVELCYVLSLLVLPVFRVGGGVGDVVFIVVAGCVRYV